MPRAECADEADKLLMRPDADLSTNFVTANVGAKLVRIDTVRIDDYLFSRNTGVEQIVFFYFGDDKYPARSAQVKPLVTFEKIELFGLVPMFANPDLGSIELKE